LFLMVWDSFRCLLANSKWAVMCILQEWLPSGFKLLPFKNDGGHCVIGELQCCRNVLVPFPRSVPWHNPVSEHYRQFLWPHGLVFSLSCTVNCGTLYRQVCAFPNHVQSIEFTTGGLQSSCRNISRMINWNRMHQSSVSSLIAKGLNTYVNKVFQFFYMYTFAKQNLETYFRFVTMGYCV
jgi:hypothetical protein